MKLSPLLWLLPFFSFLLGYVALACLHSAKDVITPAVVGLQLQPALAHLAQHNLNSRLVKEKEDTDLPAGTIISQTPPAGQTIKEGQSVFLIVSKQPGYTAPHVIDNSREEVQQKAHENQVRNKSYYVHSTAPQHTCIGQCPAPGKSLPNKQLITYLSAGNNAPVVVPDLTQQPVSAVVEFLQKHNVTVQLFHRSPVTAQHSCENCVVLDQRPLAGSIVLLEQLHTMHLQVA